MTDHEYLAFCLLTSATAGLIAFLVARPFFLMRERLKGDA